MEDKCQKVRKTGVVDILIMKYAIEKVNKDNTILPNITLGYQVDSSCESLPAALSRGIDTISLFHPDDICKKEFEECGKSLINNRPTKKGYVHISAVIGTRNSYTTIPLAGLLSLYNIPQVSPYASSRLLSRAKFGSFFRTIPSDSNQAEAMLDVLAYFNWNYVVAIGSGAEYGKLAIADIKSKSQERDICIVLDEFIKLYEDLPTQIKEIMQKIKATPNAKVVILFTLIEEIGELLLSEAEKQGVKRVWLTSEAWNPYALKLNVPLAQKVGMLTISLKGAKVNKVTQILQDMMKRDYQCDIWLNYYIKQNFNCSVTNLINDTLFGEFCDENENNCRPCKMKLQRVMDDLSETIPSSLNIIIDAVNTIAHGIHNTIQKACKSEICRKQLSIEPKYLTEEIHKLKFVNDIGDSVSFDEAGDPLNPRYSIENIQEIDGKLRYVKVGEWSTKGLSLESSKIQWHHQESEIPTSKCSADCQKGYKYVSKTGCCWDCAKCEKNTYSDTTMSPTCSKCPYGFHTDDRIHCVKTSILYLSKGESAGLAAISVSGFGLLVTFVSAVILIKFRNEPIVQQSSLPITILSLIGLTASFSYVSISVQYPTITVCNIQFALFMLLYTLLSGLLLIKTYSIDQLLLSHQLPILGRKALATKLVFLLLVFTAELVLAVILLYFNPIEVIYFTFSDSFDKWLQCDTDFTNALSGLAIIPVVVLLVATVNAFKEKDFKTAGKESKFVSFATIATCLVTLAFLPTFKYAVGYYKAVVLVFAIDLVGFIHIGCLIIPKVYGAILVAIEGPPIQEESPKEGTS